MSQLTVILLAAGQGTRMKSQLPKVLHPAAGRPLLYYPLFAAFEAGADEAVIVSSGRPEIERELRRLFPDKPIRFAVQDVPRGTGDAVRVGLEHVTSERVLIVCGDTPLLAAADLRELVGLLEREPGRDLGVMTCLLDEPSGYGRMLRDERGELLEIREHRDLQSAEQRAVREVNAGMYVGRTVALKAAVAELSPNNAQGEYYFTDVVRWFGGRRAGSVQGSPDALVGVNDRHQLRAAENQLFERIRQRHALAGVTVRGEVLIDDSVQLEQDVVLEHGVRLRGQTRIARGAFVDVGCVLTDVSVGEGAELKPYSVMSASSVGARVQIGPFSHLRPESQIDDEAHIGNFVETKKTRVRRGAKANHLAYLGDADVGERSNIGAGTIVCNYDGYQKHRTQIGADVFIGSDSQLVAPIRIGNNAFIATATTVTKDVPDDALAIGRVSQETKLGYAPRLKARLKAAKEAKK